MRRKGQVQDLILIPVMLLVLAIVGIVLLFIVNSIHGAPGLTNTDTLKALDSSTYAIRGLDSINVFIFVMLILVVGGLAYIVRSSPIGITIVLFVGIAVMLLSGMLSNVFNSVVGDTALVQTANSFPLTIGLFGKMGIFLAVGVFVVMVFLFGKPQGV